MFLSVSHNRRNQSHQNFEFSLTDSILKQLNLTLGKIVISNSNKYFGHLAWLLHLHSMVIRNMFEYQSQQNFKIVVNMTRMTKY